MYVTLEKEIMKGTMQGARRRGRPRTAWMDNITSIHGQDSPWKSQLLPVKMTEIEKVRPCGLWPTLGSRTAKEQNM